MTGCVRWLVGWSGNAFVRRSTRRTLLAYLALFFNVRKKKERKIERKREKEKKKRRKEKKKKESKDKEKQILYDKNQISLFILTLPRIHGSMKTRPSRPIRCAVWIVERMRYRPTDQPTDQRTQPVIEVRWRT